MNYLIKYVTIIFVLLVPFTAGAQEKTDDSNLDKAEEVSEKPRYKHDHRKMKGLPSATSPNERQQEVDEGAQQDTKKHDHRKDHKHL